MIRSPLITIMTDAALKAARPMKRDFGEIENLQVSRKGPGDFVTAADRSAEQILREALQKARPGYGFVLEEQGVIEGSDKTHRWHVDPLDGTINFLHGVPHFAISIGLEREGQIVAGVVYDPIKDEMFIAERGKGAYLEQPPPARLRAPRHAGRACGLRLPASRPSRASALPQGGRGRHGATSGVRRMGAAALDLAWVACGRLDLYWERHLRSWDMAAGLILVREAGGFVSDADGGEDPLAAGSVACGNEALHRELLSLLKQANR